MIQAIVHPTTKAEHVMAAYRGLADGSLKQTGGVIRWAIPSEPAKPGSIFAHIYQLGLDPAKSSIDWGPTLQQGQQALSQGVKCVQGLAMASTALSALNLGVSVVGFAIMARKMNQLQASIKVLDDHLGNGFARVQDGLGNIEAKINGVAMLLEQANEGVEWLQAGTHTTQRRMDWLKLSDLYASVESLADLEGGRRAGMEAGLHAERIRSVRVYLTGVLGDMAWPEPSVVHPTMLHQRALVLALAQAIAAEAQAWRMADETATAARVLTESLPAFTLLARDTARSLVGGDVALLGHPSLLNEVDSPVSAAVPVLLLGDRWARPKDIRTGLAAAWSEHLLKTRGQAGQHLSKDAGVRRVRVGRELAFPLAEASLTLDGLATEYSALATAGLPRSAWEDTQVRSGPPALYIRDCSLN